jgi:hypothetical protein
MLKHETNTPGLNLIYIAKVFWQKCLQFSAAIMPSPLVLATLGDATQIGSFPFESRHSSWPKHVGVLQSQNKIAAVSAKKLCQCKWFLTNEKKGSRE